MEKTFEEILESLIEKQNRRLLDEYKGMQHLIGVRDVARTLGVSVRTIETEIASGEIQPIWIRGRRVFHPDTIEAYVRDKKRTRKTQGAR